MTPAGPVYRFNARQYIQVVQAANLWCLFRGCGFRCAVPVLCRPRRFGVSFGRAASYVLCRPCYFNFGASFWRAARARMYILLCALGILTPRWKTFSLCASGRNQGLVWGPRGPRGLGVMGRTARTRKQQPCRQCTACSCAFTNQSRYILVRMPVSGVRLQMRCANGAVPVRLSGMPWTKNLA